MMKDGSTAGRGLTCFAIPGRPSPAGFPDEEAADGTKLQCPQERDTQSPHRQLAKLVSKRFAQHRVFSVARKFVSYPALYFACNLDFRGRVYACSDDLSPQGNDLQRGLLEFAEGDAC